VVLLMGFAGRVQDRERARELRARAWTLAEIAAELGASKSSVSEWCRDVRFEPRPRNRGHALGQRPHPQHLAKLAELEQSRRAAAEAVGALSDRDLFIAGIALYAGEGAKTGNTVKLANTDPRMIILFLAWMRRFFVLDEARLRVQLYLHQGLDIDAATEHWSALTGIPRSQFIKPYRAAPDPSRRFAKYPFGCPGVRYSSASTLYRILALCDALLESSPDFPG